MADLIHADTEQQRKLAIKQMEGGLFKQFDKWRNQVIKVMANIEAYIDFAESEDIEDTVPIEVKTQVTDILRLVKNPNKFLNLYIYDIYSVLKHLRQKKAWRTFRDISASIQKLFQ